MLPSVDNVIAPGPNASIKETGSLTASKALPIVIDLSTIIVVTDGVVSGELVASFTSKPVAKLTFPSTAQADPLASGTGISTTEVPDGASMKISSTNVTLAWNAATESQKYYQWSSAAIAAAKRTNDPEPPSNTTGHSPVPGHSTTSVAGAAVGGFFGGAILGMALVFGFYILRKRKQHRQHRDMQIQNSFNHRSSAVAEQPFEDIALSSTNEHKPLTAYEPKGKATADNQTVIELPKHVVTQTRRSSRSVDVNSIRSAAGKRTSVAEKRESFPAVLTSNRPRRTISISAAGLVSPIAATHLGGTSGSMEDIVKQLRMQISTLFEQIDMHVDNFYQFHRDNYDEPLSEMEQEKLRRVETPHLEDSIVGLLPAAKDACVLIKHCIAGIVTSRIDYTGRVQPSDSLLPESLVATYKLMAASTRENPTQALDAWRVESVSLLGIENIEKSMSGQVRSLASIVTSAFKPWAVSRYGVEARTSHLSSIFRQAVELGLEVFGTQERTTWVWSNVEGGAKVVVFPGLVVEAAEGDPRAGVGVVVAEPVLVEL